MQNKDLPKLKTNGFVPIDTQSRCGNRYRSKQRSYKPDMVYKKLLYKTGICAAIAVALLIVSSTNNPPVALSPAMDYASNHQLEIDEDIGRLKFVQNLDEESACVFSAYPESSVVYPADGEIVTKFGESGSSGVRMSTRSSNILCIAKATVISAGKIGDAGYVTLALDTGEKVFFYNIIPAVKINDIVNPGQPVGSLSGEYLYFEMKDGEQYIDPLEFIMQRATAALQ